MGGHYYVDLDEFDRANDLRKTARDRQADIGARKLARLRVKETGD